MVKKRFSVEQIIHHLSEADVLLSEGQTGDRNAVGEACLAALGQWAEGRGAGSMGQG